MVRSWNDKLNAPGVNHIKPSPRLSFGAKFIAAQRKREGLMP
ncbi:MULTISPECIES: hypothetical protein [unclassified Mesorhizobium]|nr:MULTISPECIES: hypothetical protein [unclassified Mesorhizobium]